MDKNGFACVKNVEKNVQFSCEIHVLCNAYFPENSPGDAKLSYSTPWLQKLES